MAENLIVTNLEEEIDESALMADEDDASGADDDTDVAPVAVAGKTWQELAAELPAERRISQTAEEKALGEYTPNRYDLAFTRIAFKVNQAAAKNTDERTGRISQNALHVIGYLASVPGTVVKGNIRLSAMPGQVGANVEFSFSGQRFRPSFSPGNDAAKADMAAFKAGIERLAYLHIKDNEDVKNAITRAGKGRGLAISGFNLG